MAIKLSLVLISSKSIVVHVLWIWKSHLKRLSDRSCAAHFHNGYSWFWESIFGDVNVILWSICLVEAYTVWSTKFILKYCLRSHHQLVILKFLQILVILTCSSSNYSRNPDTYPLKKVELYNYLSQNAL